MFNLLIDFNVNEIYLDLNDYDFNKVNIVSEVNHQKNYAKEQKNKFQNIKIEKNDDDKFESKIFKFLKFMN